MSPWIGLLAYLLGAIGISGSSMYIYFWALHRTKSEWLKIPAFLIEGVFGILLPMVLAAFALDPLRELFPHAGMTGFCLVFGLWLVPLYIFIFAAKRKFPPGR